MKDNMILGILGAVVGALLGAALWVLIGQVGFIAGIAGYAIVFCSVKGYKMLGKCLSKRGIILCVIFSFIMILVAEYVSTGILIYQAFKEEYLITLTEALTLVPEFLLESDVRNEFLKTVAVGYGLAIWASFSFVKELWIQTKVDDTIQYASSSVNSDASTFDNF